MRVIVFIVALMFTSLSYAWEPNKPINVIMGMSPGSAMDIAFRISSQQVEKNTGVKFVVNYRPGAGGTIASDIVTKADGDGYTITPAGVAGLVATDRMVVPNKSFNAGDFVYATSHASSTMSVIAHPSDSVNSIQDLIKVLRQEKTTIGDPGSGARLTYEILKDAIKFNEGASSIIRVEYKGPADTLVDVMATNVRFGIVPLPVSSQAHIGGKVKIIGITSEFASQSFPHIQTFNSIFPNIVFNLSWVIALPKSTPQGVVDWYTKEFNKALQSKEVQTILNDNFFFVDNKLLNPKDLRSKILSDEKKYEPLVNKVLDQRK